MKNKARMLKALYIAGAAYLLVMAVAAGVYFAFFKSSVSAMELLRSALDMHQWQADVSLQISSEETNAEGEFLLERILSGDETYYSVSSEDFDIYYHDGIFMTEDGTGVCIEQLKELQLPQIEDDDFLKVLVFGTKVTRTRENSGYRYQIAARGRLKGYEIEYTAAGVPAEIELQDLNLELYESNAKLTGFSFDLAFVLHTDRDIPVTVHAEAELSDETGAVLQLPECVENEDGQNILQISVTEDSVRVGSAALKLLLRSNWSADMDVGVQCSIIKYSSSMELDYREFSGQSVGRFETDKDLVYFSSDRVCSADGTDRTDEDGSFLQLKTALPAVSLIFMSSGSECTGTDDCYHYTLAVPEELLDYIAEAIADSIPEEVTLDSGTAEAKIENGELTSLTVSCEGKVRVLFLEAPVELTVTVSISEQPDDFDLPAGAAALLLEEE